MLFVYLIEVEILPTLLQFILILIGYYYLYVNKYRSNFPSKHLKGFHLFLRKLCEFQHPLTQMLLLPNLVLKYRISVQFCRNEKCIDVILFVVKKRNLTSSTQVDSFYALALFLVAVNISLNPQFPKCHQYPQVCV